MIDSHAPTGSAAPAAAAFAAQSPYSDPGRHAALVAAVAPEPRDIHRAVTATIAHYRGDPVPPTPDQLADIDRRWVAAILDAAASRCDGPLDRPRASAERVGGCCRDHSLLAVSILRAHGVPARTRLGFADYFSPDSGTTTSSSNTSSGAVRATAGGAGAGSTPSSRPTSRPSSATRSTRTTSPPARGRRSKPPPRGGSPTAPGAPTSRDTGFTRDRRTPGPGSCTATCSATSPTACAPNCCCGTAGGRWRSRTNRSPRHPSPSPTASRSSRSTPIAATPTPMRRSPRSGRPTTVCGPDG
ncbi:transglutaminase domain-containing protein [Agromyces protaetiae]|uniref:Transglutaminase domain-containing protein n=1 Tax=Agromyces protaetiae TaxID=2509455 RepID=A0A4P6FAN9_9MICO|nr:transglutaminase domain-containing protein [Agromyces protaetiae]